MKIGFLWNILFIIRFVWCVCVSDWVREWEDRGECWYRGRLMEVVRVQHGVWKEGKGRCMSDDSEVKIEQSTGSDRAWVDELSTAEGRGEVRLSKVMCVWGKIRLNKEAYLNLWAEQEEQEVGALVSYFHDGYRAQAEMFIVNAWSMKHQISQLSSRGRRTWQWCRTRLSGGQGSIRNLREGRW